ncbi:serine/threonine-protein kinase MRCK beta [Acetobacter orientalis]|uniref:Serine/threonine-protein kinase MRCK beta n=1 Tax=Acetobacter orientalis TaxID=146474 RepID=A0A2Z5ZE89_9PROT|nr:serine/threonine-protein kinase MRCK beta [Acetobacter orientalis]
MIVSNIISFSIYVAIPALRLNNDKNKLHTVKKLVDDLEKWHKETIGLFLGNTQGKFEYRYPIDVVGRLYSEILK